MITITRTKRQATPKREPLNLRKLARKGLATLDKALEPKMPTIGQELDRLMSDPDIDTVTALEAARTLIDVELQEITNA